MNNVILYRYKAFRDGVFYKELKALDSGEIRCDASAKIKRSVNCKLIIPDDVDFLTDELRVCLVKNGVEYKLGTFIITTKPKTVDANGLTTYDCEGYDKGYILERTKLESRADGYIAEGTNYVSAIKALLITCGISDFIIEYSELEMAIDREDWDVGTSYLDIINTLLSEINYNSLWFDSNGFARSEKYSSAVNRDIEFEYKSGKDSIILREHTSDDDVFSSYNVFMVGVDDVEGTAIYKTAVNDDPMSKLSTVNRGRIQAPVEMLDSVADEQTAQECADNLKFKSMLSTETATIQTEIEAGHEVSNVIGVTIPELQGKFEEIGWSIPLSVGLMTHTIRRAIYV